VGAVTTVKIIYWKDIPAVVQATDGAEAVKLELSGRFQVLIDAVAMRLGLTDADTYLDQWQHGEAVERPGSPREVAQTIAAELESRFDEFRTRGLGSN
jgi:hypothetical protein